MPTENSKIDAGAIKGIEYEKTTDFVEGYANNIHLESTVWDLKMTFGQTAGDNKVVQHTSITVPWSQLKIFHYLLGLHLLSHEQANGRIPVPKNIIFQVPEKMPKDVENIPGGTQGWEAARKHYLKFVQENPEGGPGVPLK